MEPKDIIKKGAFRKGSEVLINFDAEPGDYNIVTSTFAPGQESPFTVTVYSETPAVKMNAIEQAFLTKMVRTDLHIYSNVLGPSLTFFIGQMGR
jgi:hypothetical protein